MESNKNGKKNRRELLCLFLMLPFMFLHDVLGVLGNCGVLRSLLGHRSIELKMLRFKA